MNFKNKTIYTITELTTAIKNNLEGSFRFISVKGEISNLSTPYSGHSYFVLKDSGAQMKGVVFKNQKRFMVEPLENGKEVICHGRISVYEPRGEYQIIVDSVESAGFGRLNRQFEENKLMLEGKGRFSKDIKLPIPQYAKLIVVITSATGAAIQDFLKMHKTLHSNCDIKILPVPVQGKMAASKISKAIKLANSLKPDCIVLCRGGGSIEDLWSFNELDVADAIYKSTVPIISAIGHETDFTISDFCADMRVATPTAAAELLFTDNQEILNQIRDFARRQLISISRLINHYEQELQRHNLILNRGQDSLQRLEMRLALSKSYFIQAIKKKLTAEEIRLNNLNSRLAREAPLNKILLNQEKVKNLLARMTREMQLNLEAKKMAFSNQVALLDTVSPLATLARGYSVTRSKKPTKKVISKTTQVVAGDKISVLISDGELGCTVDFVEEISS